MADTRSSGGSTSAEEAATSIAAAVTTTQHVSQFPPPALKQIADEVSALLKQRNETVAVAETAAGGLISASLLAGPGASKIFKGGVTAYSLESRMAFCGWTQEHIKNYNGPTPEIVAGLAEHTRKALASTYAVAESGTAGPTGGTSRQRTPGYVALAVASEHGPSGTVIVVKREMDTGLGGERESNMLAFAVMALTLLKEVIEGSVKL